MKIQKDQIRNIAIFRALQLGDMLCCIPAIRALRTAFPGANITLLGLPWAETLVSRFSSYLDSFVHFPGYPGLPEQDMNPGKIVSFLKSMQGRGFDLVFQMQGNGTIVNPMIELLGAKYSAGFYTAGDFCADEERFLLYPEGIHEIERHLRLMNHIGIPLQGTHLEFPLTDQDKIDLMKLNLPVEENRYVCIHPGSRGSWRQWPPEYFAALGDYCVGQGFEVVLTGTKDETDIVQTVASLMKEQPLDTAGKTSLGAVGVLIRNAFALISNCTGVSHIASAFETKSIVISMDGEPERWAPLNTQVHRTTDWTKTPDFNHVHNDLENLLTGNIS